MSVGKLKTQGDSNFVMGKSMIKGYKLIKMWIDDKGKQFETAWLK